MCTDPPLLQHLTSYPLVSDSISAYKSNPYGQKSISLTEDIYQRVVAPFLPYLQGPYSWVAPYLAKADEYGDSALSKADERFPIVKEDTEKVKSTVLQVVHYPIRLVQDGRDYVVNSYQDESGKVGGEGVVKLVKSVVSTELRILSDGLHAVAEFVGPKKQQAEDLVKEKIDQIKQSTQK